MIHEMARIEVQAGKEAEFEAGVEQAVPLFLRSRGCISVELHRTVERPAEYLLLVRWETVDDHMVHFRESEEYQAWRALVSPFFAAPPSVCHTEIKVGPATRA